MRSGIEDAAPDRASAARLVSWFAGLAAVVGLAGSPGLKSSAAAEPLTTGVPTPQDPAAAAPPDTTIPSDSAAQAQAPPPRDAMDVLAALLLHRRFEPELDVRSPGVSWSVLPSLSYNPVYGFAFGASVSGAGRLGKNMTSRSSAISLSANYSTTGQLQVQLRGDVYSPSDRYLTKLDVRYLDTTRSTWGLGPLEPGQTEYPMDFDLTRAYGTIYRHIEGPVYFGIGYHYDLFANIVDERTATGDSTPFSQYSGPGVTRTQASGISINLLGDTRDNIVNTTQGYYLSGSARNYLKALGSDSNWQEFWLDVRLYPHLPQSSRNILAFWIYGWFTFGKAPYLNLPSIGWDTYGRGGRGYLQGRIRGQSQTYFEAEYRMQLTRDGLLGAVVFLNAVTTVVPESGIFGPTDHGGGLGIRLKWNKRSNTNIALDRAWGEEGSGGWFMGMTEVF